MAGEFFRVSRRSFVVGVCGLLGATATGCLPSGEVAEKDVPINPSNTLTPDQIRDRLDEVIGFTLKGRILSTAKHAAWQIVHGILAYGPEYEVEHEGKVVRTIDFLCNGGKIVGWNFKEGDVLDEATGRRGLVALVEPGTKTGQGHWDQWLGYMATWELPLEHKIVVDGKDHTLRDYAEQIRLDVHKNAEHEFSWTLMCLSTYFSTTEKWKSSDGSEWELGDLLGFEVDNDLGDGPCGGSHRMTGITMAVQNHLKQGGKLEGNWAKADQFIKRAQKSAQDFQNPDGFFSTNYFLRGGETPEIAQNIGTSGHVFEFLAFSLPKERLLEPWMQNAMAAMCDLLEQTKELDIECGALYHAVHGLVVYRERLFGKRLYNEKTA